MAMPKHLPLAGLLFLALTPFSGTQAGSLVTALQPSGALSANSFASIAPQAGSTLDFADYLSLNSSLTLSAAQQRYAGFSNYLASKQVDFSLNNGSAGIDYSKSRNRLRVFDGQCRQLELEFDSNGQLSAKRSQAPLSASQTARLNFFDDRVGSLTLAQAQQAIGSSGVQTGQNFVSNGNNSFDNIWRWEMSDRSGWIEIGFGGDGMARYVGQSNEASNSSADLISLAGQLRSGMSLSEVQNLLGSSGSLNYRQFPSAGDNFFVQGSSYAWRSDDDSRLWANFSNGVLQSYTVDGQEVGSGKSSVASGNSFGSNEVSRIGLGMSASDVKAIYGAPIQENSNNLVFSDSSGDTLRIFLSPEYLAPPPNTGTPTTSATTPNATTTTTTAVNNTSTVVTTTTNGTATTTTTTTNTSTTAGTTTTNTATTTTTTATTTTSRSRISTASDATTATTATTNTTTSATTNNATNTTTNTATNNTATNTNPGNTSATGNPSPTTAPTAPTPPVIGAYKVTSVNLDLQCRNQPAVTISSQISGPLSARALTANITVAPADQGKTGQLFIIAVLPNHRDLLTLTKDHGWQAATLVPLKLLPYETTTLGSHSIPVLDGKSDLTAAAGVRIYAGYGSNVQDMLANDKGVLLHRLRP